jgi:hypothetical protein
MRAVKSILLHVCPHPPILDIVSLVNRAGFQGFLFGKFIALLDHLNFHTWENIVQNIAKELDIILIEQELLSTGIDSAKLLVVFTEESLIFQEILQSFHETECLVNVGDVLHSFAE